jgi:sugar phosphate isomerase/epimerase
MIKLASPISHLFENKDYEKIILASSDVLECRDISLNYNKFVNKQELFHSNIQPIHQWGDAEWLFLRKIKTTKSNLKLLTLHIASCCDQPISNGGPFEIGGREYTRQEMKDIVKKNLIKIRELFGTNLDIAVENNNYYPTKAYRDVTEAKFISEIVYENNIQFLFDIAHAKVTCFNRNINFERYKQELPLDRTIQVHICNHNIDKKLNQAYDAHNYPSDTQFLEIKKIITKYSQIKYLTVEYYKDIKNLEISLKKIKELI